MNASVMSEPVEMSLVAALGLVIAGFLFRIAMKIASARRRGIIVDRPKSHWLDDPNDNHRHELIDEFMERPESNCMDDRNEHELHDGEQRPEFVHERAKLVDDVQDSLATITSDDIPRRLFRNDDELQETVQRTDRDPIVADEIRKREDALEQLKRDLDRLLQSPKVA